MFCFAKDGAAAKKNANAHKFVACERSKDAVVIAAVCEPTIWVINANVNPLQPLQ
jgi:hypothetical protein